MKIKTAVLFIAALAFSLFAASYRFYDSAHTIAFIKAGGGEARHPIVLDPGLGRYTLIATATVIPPYRGSIRVALEGMPEMEYQIYNNEPAFDLSPYRHPSFRDNVFYDVQPMDKIALWVVIKPKENSLPTDLSVAAAVSAAEAGDCCTGPPPAEGRIKTVPGATAAEKTAQILAFYDLKSGKKLLGVPITFRGEGGSYGAGH